LDKKVKTAVIFNSFLTEGDLLKAILQDFGFPSRGRSKKERIDVLNHFLVERFSQGENALLIIDEAQNLSIPVLEQIRMLSNLETEKEKILQIILMGQLELNQKLKSPKLKQLNQRIAIRHLLLPLSPTKTEDYIQNRLMVAGAHGNVTFSKSALKAIYQFSQGTPRLINLLCDRALLGGFIDQTFHINKEIVKKAVKSLRGEEKDDGSFFSVGWAIRLGRWWLVSIMVSIFSIAGVALGNGPLYSWKMAKNFLGEKMQSIALLTSGGGEKSVLSNEAPEQPKNPPEARRKGGR